MTPAQGKTKRSRKNKKSRRKVNAPKVVIVDELPPRPDPGPEFDLREWGLPGRRVVEFPQMKGRTVRTIRFYTSADDNSVAISFHDQTELSLHLEPALVLSASLLKHGRWEAEMIKEWPPIHSEPRNPEE